MKLDSATSSWEGWAKKALALIRECHLALAQAKEEQPFLQEMCRLLVDVGGYSLAWVGLAAHNQAQEIQRLAHAGLARGLLEMLPRTWAAKGPGSDPTGAAIRTGQPVFCADLLSEPACADYREVAATLGLTSCLALPLSHQGQVLGALTIYASGPETFSAEEREFLQALTAFFCQGWLTLRLREDLHRGEERLALQNQILDSSPYAVLVFDLQGRITWVNEAAVKVRGCSREELLGLAWGDLDAPEFQAVAEAQRQKLMAAGAGEVVFESAHRRQDGAPFPVECHCRIIEVQGRPAILSLILDISERRNLEETLRETEERYRSLFNNTQVGIFRWRLSDGRMLECNDRFAHMLGYESQAELVREFVVRDQFVEPDIQERLLEQVGDRRLQNFETRVYRRDGSVAWLRCSARLQGDRGHLEGLATDINELRQAKDSLQKSAAEHRTLVEQLLGRTLLLAAGQQQLNQEIQRQKGVTENFLGRCQEGVAGFDQDFVITLWNPAMERFSGLPKTRALGQNLFRVLPFLKEVDEKTPLLAGGGRRGLVDPDRPLKLTATGPEGFYDGQAAALLTEAGEIRGGMVIIRDVTPAKRVENALKEHQGLVDGLMASVVEGIAILDRHLSVVRVNPTAEQWFGHEQPLLGKTCYAVIHGASAPCEPCPARRTLLSGEPAHEVVTKWGPGIEESAKVELFAYPLKDPDSGDTVGVILRMRDITARIKTEASLKENLERLKLVMTNLPLVLGRLYPDDTVDFLGNNLEQLTGFSPQEFAPGGRPWTEVVLEEDREPARASFLQALGTDRTYVRQYRVRTADGRTIWIQENGQITCDAQGRVRHTDIVLLDVTARKQAEEMRPQFEAQLRQVQRMDAIGSLAGGIAHDFNNILGVMVGYTEMVLMSLPEDDGRKRRLQQVLKAGKRGKELVSQILAFSRPSPQERKPMHLSPVIKETLNMLRATLPATIELKVELEKDQDTILADSTQMHQVVINLCTNAAHAMRDQGGVLDISLKAVHLDAKTAAQFHGLSAGPHIRLIVRDTGHGMDRDTLEKIFDPFFTTKKMEEGTGMGLAVVHGIIKAHKGAITVQSEVGRGTEFQIYLPQVEAAELPGGVETPKIENGKERLLFVDDEEWLVDMWKEILESLGYRMTVTTKPLEALEIFKARPREFDLVIADQTMPQMTGLELAQELIALRPELPVILVTGYSQLVTPEKALEAGIRDYIMKPLSISELTNAIRKVLGKNPQG